MGFFSSNSNFVPWKYKIFFDLSQPIAWDHSEISNSKLRRSNRMKLSNYNILERQFWIINEMSWSLNLDFALVEKCHFWTVPGGVRLWSLQVHRRRSDFYPLRKISALNPKMSHCARNLEFVKFKSGGRGRNFEVFFCGRRKTQFRGSPRWHSDNIIKNQPLPL